MLTIKYNYTCDFCGVIDEVELKYFYGCEIPKPSLPVNWQTINHSHICPKHVIKYIK